jgi:magnesium-transporting ATPase (P-type)
MIQRIQSVWLLLAATCAALSFKLPFYIGDLANEKTHQLTATDNFLIIVVTAVVMVLSLVIIFLFKKRIVQLRLSILGILLEALLIFLYYMEVRKFTPGSGTYAITALLHGAVIFFLFLAAKNINKDEKMVKDSDRLR